MKTIIILVFVIFVFWIFRKKITALLLFLIKRLKNKPKTDVFLAETGDIFRPAGTVRTFNLSLELHEQGDGTVKIVVKK